MIVSIKRNQVEDDKFLFVSLVDALDIKELQDPNRGSRQASIKQNSREIEANWQLALQVDQYLLSYWRQHEEYASCNVDVYLRY